MPDLTGFKKLESNMYNRLYKDPVLTLDKTKRFLRFNTAARQLIPEGLMAVEVLTQNRTAAFVFKKVQEPGDYMLSGRNFSISAAQVVRKLEIERGPYEVVFEDGVAFVDFSTLYNPESEA